MLEFVNVSGSSGGQDETTRRKVRSQAMRDFRRRQREERQATKSSKSMSSSKKRSSVSNKRNSASIVWPGRERATSTASDASQTLSRRPSVRAASPKSVPLTSQQEGEIIFQAESTPHSIGTPFDLSDIDLLEPWQYNDASTTPDLAPELLCWPPDSPTLPPSLIQEPSSWAAAETEDPFENPAQISQMLGFCRSYIHWLRPGVQTETAGNMVGQAWDRSKCPMLLAACCLASVGHLDAVQPNRPVGNYEVYKARVLKEISKRMSTSEAAVSNETLSALGCLVSFEMSKGSGEAVMHLRGLKSIIDLQNAHALDRLQTDGVHLMLETLDLLHAVLYDEDPILVEAPTLQSEEALSDQDMPSWLSRLLFAEQDNFQKQGLTAYTHNLQRLPSTIAHVGAVLKSEIIEQRNYCRIEEYRKDLETFGRESCSHHVTAPDAQHLGRCCFQLMCILFNLVVNKVPHRHQSNQPHVNELFDAVRRIKNSTWSPIPYLRLLALLTAATTTSDQSIKSFFKAELVRSISQMGSGEWHRVQAYILRFLEANKVLQRSDRISTPPLEMASFQSPTDTFGPDFFSREDYTAALTGKQSVASSETWQHGLLEQTLLPREDTPYDERDIDPLLRA